MGTEMSVQSGNGEGSRRRPGERVYHTVSEAQLVGNGPWRSSAILNGPERQANENHVTDSRPPWGKGELITSALRRQAMQHKSATLPSAEELAFMSCPMSQRLASVQNELQDTYIARQFKRHLESQGESIPEFLSSVL